MATPAAQAPPSFDGSIPLLNPKHETFAQLIAAGFGPAKAYTTAGYKAKNVGVAGAESYKLLKNPLIIQRVASLKPAADAKVATQLQLIVAGKIHERVERIRGYDERKRLMYQLMQDRANDPEHQDVPGIRTGLLVVTWTTINKERVKEAKFDMALQQAINNLDKQAAIELQQWVERTQELPWDGDPATLTDRQLDQLLAYFSRVNPVAAREKAAALGLPDPVGELIEAKVDPKPAEVDFDPLG